MSTTPRWFLRWHGLPVVTGVLAIAAMGALLARATTAAGDGSGASVPVVGMVVIAVIAVALALCIVRLGAMFAGVDPEAASIANRLVTEPDQQRLLTRWLERTRWARNVGGVAGLVWWLFGTSAQGDILLCGVGGVAIGSIAAQLHHVRTPTGRRTASLDRRSVEEYIPTAWIRRMVVLSMLSVALIAIATTASRPGSAVRWGVASLVVLGAVHLVQRRVAGRPRPALGANLQLADDLARGLAIDRGLAQPATYFSLVLLAHGAGSLTTDFGGNATAVSVIAWLYALRLWWLNRRLGLDHVMHVDRPVHAERFAASRA